MGIDEEFLCQPFAEILDTAEFSVEMGAAAVSLSVTDLLCKRVISFCSVSHFFSTKREKTKAQTDFFQHEKCCPFPKKYYLFKILTSRLKKSTVICPLKMFFIRVSRLKT